jgi:hypothetical protein
LTRPAYKIFLGPRIYFWTSLLLYLEIFDSIFGNMILFLEIFGSIFGSVILFWEIFASIFGNL